MATYFQDYINNEDGDLYTRNGDFVLAFSDFQHIENILRSNPGNYLYHPQLGVGNILLNSVIPNSVLETNIISQLQGDGYLIRNVNINGEPLPMSYFVDNANINIDAYRPW